MADPILAKALSNLIVVIKVIRSHMKESKVAGGKHVWQISDKKNGSTTFSTSLK